MRILGVIPARYFSTRFPGKPLADLLGKSMIQRVYSQCLKSTKLTEVVIATDHEKIIEHVTSFNGNVCFTSDQHVNGTDRCFEVLQKYKSSFDFVINIQGDEPFIDPKQIDILCASLSPKTEISTIIQKISTPDQLFSSTEVKVVKNKDNEAIYFSRSPIPYVHQVEKNCWLEHRTFFRHIGLYAYRSDVLEKLSKLKVSYLEKTESLEQLRWIENKFVISTVETNGKDSICIDTPEDLEKAVTLYAKFIKD